MNFFSTDVYVLCPYRCLANATWSLDKARQDFQVAKQEGKIPQEAFIK